MTVDADLISRLKKRGSIFRLYSQSWILSKRDEPPFSFFSYLVRMPDQSPRSFSPRFFLLLEYSKETFSLSDGQSYLNGKRRIYANFELSPISSIGF